MIPRAQGSLTSMPHRFPPEAVRGESPAREDPFAALETLGE